MPAIIFAAGYNLHRDHFFDNFWLIFYHGIICTIITFIILSVAALLFKDWGLVDFGEDEILLLTATLCATVFNKFNQIGHCGCTHFSKRKRISKT